MHCHSKCMKEKQDVKHKRIPEQILEVLHKSAEPLRESELAKRIGTGRNVIHYHLKKLTEGGMVISNEKKYSLDEKSAVASMIVEALAKKECNSMELQDIGFDKIHIKNALSLLEGEGRIYRTYPEVMKGSRDFRYALAPFAYSEIGICPICKKNISPSERVIKTEFVVQAKELRTVSIHIKCYSAYKFGGDFCCDHCGLPISPKLMDRQQIDRHSIIDYFYKIESDTIAFLEGLQMEINSRVGGSDFHIHDFKNWMVCNTEIKKYYTDFQEKHNVGDIPEWILESMKSEEEIETRNLELDSKMQERHDRKRSVNTFWKVYRDLNFILTPSDLSNLGSAEEFVTGIMKYREKLPEDYNIKSRIKEIWSAAQKLRQENERTIRNMYEKLLGPSGYLYTRTSPTWAVKPDEYELFYDDLTAERPPSWSSIMYDLFHSTTLAYKHDGKIYHPYCAEKLGLTNSSYCINNNNTKLKGGDINEQEF